ncbi:hypothetical protein BDZ94DRAFT_1326582 [Collybia nuda]|uniref:Bromo domain-containing protein n=1 Tax=Collybia nuda TaxID=64659 RepID=A0A9P5XWT8_9AGAR|nr:hypothetical protein BDZ94DRAFT_1326582 [Collybia nuda]
MSTRATRRGNYIPVDAPAAFNTSEALILAQAVWEHGASSWQTVAKVLTKHPLISRPKSFFTAQSCHAMYDILMKEAGLDQTEANNAIHAPMNHKLAEKHFRTRFEELRGLIIAEETQFKTLVSEIEQIRAGRWDAETPHNFTETPSNKPEPSAEFEEPSPIDGPASQEKALQFLHAEVFDGSDLSGTTNTPSSKSQDDPESQASLCDSKIEIAEKQEEHTTVPTMTSQVTSVGLDSGHDASPIQIDLDEESHGLEEENEIQELVDEPSPVPLPTIADSNKLIREASLTGGIEGPGDIHVPHVYDDEEEEGETDDRMVQKEEEEETEGVQELEILPKEDTNEGLLTDDEEVKTESARISYLSSELAVDLVESTLEKKFTQGPEPKDEADEYQSMPDGEAEMAASPERVVEEEVGTSGDEPLQATRRSTRRRSSAHLPPMRLAKPRRPKRVSTEAAATPPVALEEEIEVDPSADANDTDALSEGHPVDGDDDGVMSAPHESSAGPRRRDAKRKASAVESIESPREKKRARDDSEPVDEDETSMNINSRTRRRGDRTEEQAALKRFQNVIIMLHTQISQHRNGNIFHNPIKTSEAPDYHEIVKQPTDLKKIKMKIKDGTISNSLEFKREIFHMFANAMMYNRPGSDVYVMAEDMMLESEVQIETFRQTEGLVRGVHRI